jgi:tetratricopeptide (TPR) repeat protein
MRSTIALCVLMALGMAAARGAEPVKWAAKDAAGRDVVVPSADGPAVVAFLRPGQQQSDDALQQIKAVITKQPAARLVLVFSGPDNAAAGPQFAAARMVAAPAVADADYAIAGRMNVHVWPATVVVGTDGVEIGRLTSVPSSFAADLQAHVDLAAKQIDQSTHDKRLSTKQVVAATSQQAATRFLIIANALLERGQVDQALVEIEQGLTRDANDVSLRLARAKVLLKQAKHADALAAADQLAGAAPSWQVNSIRAEALVGLQRWPDAKAAVAEAVKLNPDPSRAHYLAGLIAQHDQDWKSAADAFRLAFETRDSHH